MAFTFDGPNKRIILSIGTTVISIADMYSRWVDWVGVSDNSKYLPAFRTVGGDALTSAVDAGVYFFLQNDVGWRIKPAEENANILLAGNLAPEDAAVTMLIPTSGAYTVLVQGLQPITQNVDSILAESIAGTESTKRMIEGLRPHHRGYGNVWYYDPVHGNNANDGKSPATAFLTFDAVHAAVQDYGHDIILIVPAGGGPSICNNPWTITKNYLFIRGMGYNAHVHPTSTTAGGNLIEIHGNGVELSGVHIEGVELLGTPNVNGIVVTGTNVLIEDLTVEECTGHGIVMTTEIGHDDRATINRCHIRMNGKSGLQYNQGNHLEITDTDFEENAEHGVDLTGAGATEDPMFHHCNFLRNTGYGLKINNTSVVGTTIESECEFAFNGSGDYIDNGTDTIFQETTANADLAAAVWANVTGAAVAVRLAEAWGRLGLDPSKPLVTGQTQISFGDIVMAMTGDATQTTVTRAP